MSNAEKAMGILSRVQLDFIDKELGFGAETVRLMEDEQIDDLYDKVCDIEVEETMKADDGAIALSDRGKLAEGIVTVLGNELYTSQDDGE